MIRRLLAFAIGLMAFITIGTAPASAHEVNIYQGADHGWLGAYHNYTWIDDRECDGHSVSLEIWYAVNGYTGVETNWDNDCGSYYHRLDVSTVNIIGLRVCEHSTLQFYSPTLYCTAWDYNVP